MNKPEKNLSKIKNGKPPKRRRTQEERRLETSGKLLKATIDLLLEQGYSRFRIADAAAKAKVSRGSQTHHFATKNELIEAAIERFFANELSQTQLDSASTTDSELLAHASQRAKEFLFSKPFRVSLNMLISTGAMDHLADGVRAISERGRGPLEEAWVGRIVESGVRRKDAEDVLGLLWNVQRGLAVEKMIEGDRKTDSEDELHFTVDLLNEYLDEKRSLSSKVNSAGEK